MSIEESKGQKPKGQKLKECGTFLYNSESGEILGRTVGSWGKIGLFYLIFYGALAGFFAVCVAVFFQTLSNKHPTQMNMYSLLKQNPGMGFRPFPSVLTTLIKFTANDPESFSDYVQNMDEALRVYSTASGKDVVDCSGLSDKADDVVCSFPQSLLGDSCTRDNHYGYMEGKPCVLLKINKVYGWEPQPFENETDSEHEAGMAADAMSLLKDRYDPDYVGVTCEGETESDHDNIRNVTFTPKGFPFIYFPYLNQDGYQAPVVMAQFDIVPGRIVMIWCRVWAKNIKHHRVDLQGGVHFELLVDQPKV